MVLHAVAKSAISDGLPFEAPPFCQEGFPATEADVSQFEVGDALVATMIVVVIHEGGDGGLFAATMQVRFPLVGGKSPKCFTDRFPPLATGMTRTTRSAHC